MEFSNQGDDINVEPPNLVAFFGDKETTSFKKRWNNLFPVWNTNYFLPG